MSTVKIPRPVPTFFEEAQQLSTKKARYTPRDQVPPKPPAKTSSCSRFFLQNRFAVQQKAQAISFRNSENSSLSKHYDDKRTELYFEQCFDVISLLGAGSFGEVFKVQSKEDGQFYAVKRSKECFKGELDRKLKLEEVKKHELLPKHPNCVKFIKAWEERQRLYIQTELCETSLCHISDENHEIPERLIWKYMVDLLLAVKHLHNHELLHLDIKPANIFISKNGICKLGDFGLVVDLSKPNLSEAQEGDPKYLALELMEGNFTKAADIFSLGITMLELACDLDLPRGDEAWHQLRMGHIPPEFTKHLSPELKEIILWMMTPDYRERPLADTVLKHPVFCKVRRWRRSELRMKSMVSRVWDFSRIFVSTLSYMWFILWWPFAKVILLKKKEQSSFLTPKRSNLGFEASFSDDEYSDTCKDTFGIPFLLTDSSTSGESHNGSFATSGNSEYIVNSTPNALLRRSIHQNENADLNESNLYFGSPKRPTHPFLFEDEPSKISLGPKNLLEVFDSISDEDDVDYVNSSSKIS